MPSVHVTEIDNVPVYWQDAPGPLTAGLMFGCGTRDETFVTIGVTHLVAHLVMSTLPRVHHDHNPSVDLCATEFTATGRPEQIVDFLRGVCEGISSLPVDRLAQEASVLEAENGFATHPTAAALLTRRYGIGDVGLETFTGPGHERLDAHQVLAHAARYFVAGNAVLWLTGPPPDGLRLPLPAGERPRRIEPVPLAQDGPRWSHEAVEAPGLLLSGVRDAAWNVAMALLIERLRDEARHRRGLSYEVFGDVITTGPLARQYVVVADALPDHEGDVAAILWEQTRRLAAEGPTDAELAHEKAGYAEAYDDPRWPAEEARQQATAGLLGLVTDDPDGRLREVASVTRADVMNRLSGALPSALIALPFGASVSLEGVEEGGCPSSTAEPGGHAFSMKAPVRLLARLWRPDRFYLTGTGIMRKEADGRVHEANFADVVGVQVDDGIRVVFAGNGCIFPIPAAAYRDGEALAAAVDRAIPRELRFGTDASVDAEPSPMRTLNGVLTERPRWYRWVNGVAAVVLALLTAVLYLAWDDGLIPGWIVIVCAVGILPFVWDARPRRRRVRIATAAPDAADPKAD